MNYLKIISKSLLDLILKTSTGATSNMDRNAILKRINSIKETVNQMTCLIYI